MASYRVAIQFPADTALPKDVITINPHFNGTDPNALANALSANIAANPVTTGHQHTIKVYKAEKSIPNYPLATVSHAGTAYSLTVPREVALCCSYYTTYNRPRYRGRLYMPSFIFGGAQTLRPTTLQRQNVIDWVKNVFGTAMPAAHNWIVWSVVEQAPKGGVSDLWVDDEWDTIRSRGLTATTRTTATFP